MTPRAALPLLITAAAVALSACTALTRKCPQPQPPAPSVQYDHAQWSQVTGWETDRVQEAWPAFLQSCKAIGTRAEWVSVCAAAQQTQPQTSQDVRAFFERYFEPYGISSKRGGHRESSGLITGYYEPILHGARSPTPQFSIPLYSPPPDLLTVDLTSLYPELKGKPVRARLDGNKVVPYYSRGELARDPGPRGNEIVWVDNALDAHKGLYDSLELDLNPQLLGSNVSFGKFLAQAYTSPLTLGIIIGYLVGKPLGTAGCAWLVTKLSHGRVRPSVGWGAVAGAGTVAGIGFTVSLLIASLALTGDTLAEAKLGILSAVVAASALTWVIFRLVNRLPVRARFRALLGTAEVITDLAVPVDPDRDHIRGPEESMVTMVEYGDFECPYCGMAEPVVRELLRDYGEIRYVWRHLPLTDVHPNAQMAAEAAEAAARQGAFWEMHDLLLDHQDALHPRDLVRYADSLGLDTEKFIADLRKHAGRGHVEEDLESADLSNVSGTPTFFVNGKRHYGAYDIETLKKAVKLAKARALINA